MSTFKQKGVFVSIIVIFVLLMISGGSFFTALAGKQTVEAEVTYSTRDVSNLAETRIRAEQYQKNLGDELLYSFTQASYLEAQKEHSWEEEDDIPSEGDIKDSLKSQVLNHDTYGINNQKMIYGCSASPEYQNLGMPDNHTVKLTPSQDTRISCNEEYTAAAYNLSINKTKENPDNNYIPIAVYATNVAQKFLDLMPETASATGEKEIACRKDEITATEKETARDIAKQRAKDNFRSQTEGNLTQALEQTSGPSYVEPSSQLELPNEEYEELDSEHDTSCTYTETYSCSDPECSCTSPGTCTVSYPDGESFYVKYRYIPPNITAVFGLEDTEHQIKVWKDGEVKRENLNYSFSIRKELNN